MMGLDDDDVGIGIGLTMVGNRIWTGVSLGLSVVFGFAAMSGGSLPVSGNCYGCGRS